jgi:hypothetical protein
MPKCLATWASVVIKSVQWLPQVFESALQRMMRAATSYVGAIAKVERRGVELWQCYGQWRHDLGSGLHCGAEKLSSWAGARSNLGEILPVMAKRIAKNCTHFRMVDTESRHSVGAPSPRSFLGRDHQFVDGCGQQLDTSEFLAVNVTISCRTPKSKNQITQIVESVQKCHGVKSLNSTAKKVPAQPEFEIKSIVLNDATAEVKNAV